MIDETMISAIHEEDISENEIPKADPVSAEKAKVRL